MSDPASSPTDGHTDGHTEGQTGGRQDDTAPAPPGDVLRLAIGLGILSQLFQTRIAALLEPTGLTYNQLSLLSHLARATEPSTIGEVAAALEVNQPGVSKIVQRLEEAGLVSVAEGVEDRRRKIVSITPAGIERLVRSMQALQPDVTSWFDRWTADELKTFDRSVDRLIGWLDANRISH